MMTITLDIIESDAGTIGIRIKEMSHHGTQKEDNWRKVVKNGIIEGITEITEGGAEIMGLKEGETIEDFEKRFQKNLHRGHPNGGDLTN